VRKIVIDVLRCARLRTKPVAACVARGSAHDRLHATIALVRAKIARRRLRAALRPSLAAPGRHASLNVSPKFRTRPRAESSMHSYRLSHLADDALLRAVSTLVAQDRATTAALLAHLAEVDTRRLYLPAGHPSMFAYCVEALRLSEAAAYKRIQAARVARGFP